MNTKMPTNANIRHIAGYTSHQKAVNVHTPQQVYINIKIHETQNNDVHIQVQAISNTNWRPTLVDDNLLNERKLVNIKYK